MKIHMLTPKDIVKAINKLEIFYGEDYKYEDSPLHVMVYQELSKLSKKEMESVLENEGLYSLIINNNNPYLFSALMDKKAFEHQLHPYAKWLLAHNAPSVDLHNTVFTFEKQLADQPKTPESIRKTDKDILIKMVRWFSSHLNKESKQKLFHQFHTDFILDMEKEIVESIYECGKHESEFNQYILTKFAEDKIDINKYGLMNKKLPWTNLNHNFIFEFSIFWTEHENIKKLLSNGFKFNQHTYSYHNKSLLEALFDDGCEETMKLLLPHLEKISLQDMTDKEKLSLSKNPKTQELYYSIYVETTTKNWPQSNLPEKIKMKI